MTIRAVEAGGRMSDKGSHVSVAQPPPPQRNRGTKQNKRQAKASKFAKLAVNFLLKDDWVCFMKTLRPDLPVELTRKLFDMMDSTREGIPSTVCLPPRRT